MFSIIQSAGWPIYPLLIASVIAVTLVIERFLSLRRDKIIPPHLLAEVLSVVRNKQLTVEAVEKLGRNSPLGFVLAAGLRYLALTPSPSREGVKEALEDAGHTVAAKLEKYLNALGTIASIAPLMGLFGTVIGMIEIFGAQGSSVAVVANPQQLAHGISIALINTAFGLAVAIPTLIFYRVLRGKIDVLLLQLEDQSLKFLEQGLVYKPSGSGEHRPGLDV